MAHTTTGTENEAAIPAIASLAAVADALGEAALAADACELARRVAERRFFVACVGQFKRGKSSLVNALVGASILPTGVAPVTTVVTVVRYGESRAARVTLPSGTLTIEPSALRGCLPTCSAPVSASSTRPASGPCSRTTRRRRRLSCRASTPPSSSSAPIRQFPATSSGWSPASSTRRTPSCSC
jgi:hypothetical protein